MSKCNCKVCNRNKDFYDKMGLLPEPQRAYWEGLYGDLCMAEMDNNYHDAIFKGQWPSGKEVLLQAMAKYYVQVVVKPKDHIIAQVVNNLRDVAIQYHDTQQLRSRIQDAIVPLLEKPDES